MILPKNKGWRIHRKEFLQFFSRQKFGWNFQGKRKKKETWAESDSHFLKVGSYYIPCKGQATPEQTFIWKMFPSGVKLWKTNLWCDVHLGHFLLFQPLPFCLKFLQPWWILGHDDGISSFSLFLDNTINFAQKEKSEGAINSQSGTKQSLGDTGPQSLALNSEMLISPINLGLCLMLVPASAPNIQPHGHCVNTPQYLLQLVFD